MRFGIVCCISLHFRNDDFFYRQCEFIIVLIAAKIKVITITNTSRVVQQNQLNQSKSYGKTKGNY
jgi:hypothetical protein